ncbi:hypothetical protein MNB_SV-14-335 [hydrothermal vent metagenome]|uniref:PPM-type phosphatase domain-containing protein n=1 Tax=hydrothermal vent metagenome TaxID=652676 RepID=A0A1W1C3A2_9ZZZZ
MSWSIVKASVVGNGHIKDNIPCQDSCDFKIIDDGCGIAIVADGAGSCANSHIGSEFVTGRGIELLIIDSGWNKTLPSEEVWREKAIPIAKEVSESLREFSKENEYEYKSLSSTFIVSFFSKDGICSLNIGDGRGAIKVFDGEWKSIVTPYHGEQVGMTVFLTSNIWGNQETYIFTTVKTEKIEAFIIMSDGYEKISFECYQKGEDGKYYDPNRPFAKFLDFTLKSTQNFLKTNTIEEVNKKWEQFLKNGNRVLEEESDDKSMIFGLFSDKRSMND